MVHLVSIMLGELDVQAILSQTKNFDAVCAKRLCNLHSKLGMTPAPNVQHQQGVGLRLPSRSGIRQIPPSPNSRMATLIRRISTDIILGRVGRIFEKLIYVVTPVFDVEKKPHLLGYLKQQYASARPAMQMPDIARIYSKMPQLNRFSEVTTIKSRPEVATKKLS